MAADGLSTSAEVGHDSPRGDSGADRVGGKRLAIWRNDAGPCLETAVGEQNIGGDDDRRGTRAFRDPVIGGIEAGPHHDPRDKRMDRYAHPPIADDGKRKSVGSGKRGSVSVDLGGRRIIKKKKETRKMTEDRKASKIWKHQSRNCKSDRAREN